MSASALASIGIDIGKDNFRIVALDHRGEVVHKSRCKREQVVAAALQLDAPLIAMEACGGAHELARRLAGQGRQVRLLVAADVRPFVRRQKNDSNDAQAIAEAALRPTVRTVGIKSVEQQDAQLLHRVRARLVKQRTALINQARAMLLEAGITIGAGRKRIARRLPLLLADEATALSPSRRALLTAQMQSWRSAEEQIAAIDGQLKAVARGDDRCRRLLTIPGVGVLTATALVAAVGSAQEFGTGRDLAAWLGLVPRQHSTGGVPRLLGISKRGDTYLRWLFIHGGRSVREHLPRAKHAWGPWLTALEARMHPNKATAAVAAKLVRLCWALLRKGGEYQAQPIPIPLCSGGASAT